MAQFLPLLLVLLMSSVPLRGCEEVEPPSNRTELQGTCPFSYCALEEEDNYTLLLDGTVVTADNLHHNISYYDNLSRPVICGEEKTTGSLPIILFAVSVIAVLLSIIGSVSLLVTYSLFKELRTLPGQVIMNLTVTSLAESVVLILTIVVWNDYVYMYFVQSRYIWMGLIGFEMSRTIYRGYKLYPDWSDKRKAVQLLLYMLIGWGIPIVLIGVPASIYTHNTEKGVNIMYAMAIILIAIMFLFNGGTVIFLSIILTTASARQKKLKGHKINFFRVFISLLMLLGVVRFISIAIYLIGAGSYISLILGVALEFPQPLVISIVLLCNKRVGRMYLSLCHGRKYVTSYTG